MALVLSLTIVIINKVYAGEPSRDLIEIEEPTKIAFYDFDRTLAKYSYGGTIVKLCRGFYNSTFITNPCDAEDELLNTFLGLPDPTLSAKIAFGNQTRIDRLKQHFDTILAEDSPIRSNGIYVVSTSWGEVPALEWKKFIAEVLKRVGLDAYFPYDNILTLDDPGPGIQADKGAPIKTTIEKLGVDISQAQCIFVDDKQGNLNWALSDAGVVDANGRNYCDTLLIQERDGMDGTDLNYIEARSIFEDNDCGGENEIGSDSEDAGDMFSNHMEYENKLNDQKYVHEVNISIPNGLFMVFVILLVFNVILWFVYVQQKKGKKVECV